MKSVTCEELNQQIKVLNAAREDFFNRAFEGQSTPENLKRLSRRLCQSYGINGICDPQYIANVIAFELGMGDGKGQFNPQPETFARD